MSWTFITILTIAPEKNQEAFRKLEQLVKESKQGKLEGGRVLSWFQIDRLNPSLKTSENLSQQEIRQENNLCTSEYREAEELAAEGNSLHGQYRHRKGTCQRERVELPRYPMLRLRNQDYRGRHNQLLANDSFPAGVREPHGRPQRGRCLG